MSNIPGFLLASFSRESSLYTFSKKYISSGQMVPNGIYFITYGTLLNSSILAPFEMDPDGNHLNSYRNHFEWASIDSIKVYIETVCN